MTGPVDVLSTEPAASMPVVAIVALIAVMTFTVVCGFGATVSMEESTRRMFAHGLWSAVGALACVGLLVWVA